MFLALRDIRTGWGRFSLMTGVIALITVLLVLLSGLTQGLGRQNTSAIESFGDVRFALAPAGGKVTWSDSVIEQKTRENLQQGLDSEAILVTRGRVTKGDLAASLVVIGRDSSGDDTVSLPRSIAAQTGAAAGDRIHVNGIELTASEVKDDQWYSHSPVLWTSRSVANTLAHSTDLTTAVIIPSASEEQAQHRASALGLELLDGRGALTALPGYSSENGSLTMIQGFLYGISALVVVAFGSVWTIQRTRDIAVMRALGAGRRYVLRDTLGQGALLLVIGATIGLVIGLGLSLLAASGGVPVLVGAATTALPAVGVVITGMVGFWLASRRVTTIDPQLALGGN